MRIQSPGNSKIEYVYDANTGRVVTVKYYTSGEDTADTVLTYYPDGNVKTVTTPKGDTITYEREALNSVSAKMNLLSKVDFPTGDDITYAYFNDGVLKTGQVGSATVTCQRYSSGVDYGRRWKEDGAVSSTNDKVEYTEYYADGVVKKVKYPGAGTPVTLYRDDLGRISSIADHNGKTTTYAYDPVSLNLTRIQLPNGTSANYTYDDLNRIVGISNRESVNEVIDSFAYQYQNSCSCNMGLVTRTSFQDGRYVTYDYDGLGRLVEENYQDARNAMLHKFEYDYDLNNNRLWKRFDGNSSKMIYYSSKPDASVPADAVFYASNQLRKAWTPTSPVTYTAGNRIDVTGTITEPNIDRIEVTPNSDAGKKKTAQLRGGFFIARGIELNDSTTNQVKAEAFDELGKHADTTNTNITLETSVDVRYTYDDNGNLTQKNDYSTGTLKTTTYVYSNANLLIQVNLPDNKWEKYYYDGLGRRYKVEVNDGQTTTTKQYVFSRWFMIRELDGAVSPSLAREYIGDGRRVLYGKDGQNNFYYAHYDRDINVSSITNGSGNEVTFYEYDAFGNLMAMAGADVLGIGFASGRLAAGSNMLFVGTGYYDPQAGRAIQPDAPQRRSLNLYIACTTSPGGLPFGPWTMTLALGLAVVICGLWLLARRGSSARLILSAAGVSLALTAAAAMVGCGVSSGGGYYPPIPPFPVCPGGVYPNCSVVVFGGHGGWVDLQLKKQLGGTGDLRRFGATCCLASESMGLLPPYLRIAPFPPNWSGSGNEDLSWTDMWAAGWLRQEVLPNPYMYNGGFGLGEGAFFEYNKAAIEAAKGEARELARDCKCQCFEIAVYFRCQTRAKGGIGVRQRVPGCNSVIERVPCEKNAAQARFVG